MHVYSFDATSGIAWRGRLGRCLLGVACLTVPVASTWSQPTGTGNSLPERVRKVPHPNPAPPEGRERIEVQRFEFEGNTLISSEVLQSAVTGLTGWRLMSDLTAAAQAAQKVYVDAGYGGVIVYPAPFDRRNSSVKLSVVEGRIGLVKVQARTAATGGQVRRSIPDLKEGHTPNLQRIDMQVQMANENPSRNTHVTLLPGAKTGEIDAEVSVRERPVGSGTVGIDNTGNAQTGRYRAQASWQYAQVSQRDDIVALQFQTSVSHPSRVKVFSAAYRLPLYGQLWMLDALVGSSNIDGGSVASPVGDIRFGGNGLVTSLRGTRFLPRWGDLDQRLTVSLDRRNYRTRCEIDGLPAGACGTSTTDVSVYPLSLDYTLRSGPLGGSAVFADWAVNAGFQANTRLVGRGKDSTRFANARLGATSDQSLLRWASAASVRLGDLGAVRVRFSGQSTASLLIPGEQFGMGGSQTVRGYAEREMGADRALLASLEWQGPILGANAADAGRWQPIVFMDAGQLRNNSGTPCNGNETRCSVSSLGIGLRVVLDTARVQLDVARALQDGISTERGDSRGHLSVLVSF